MGWSSTGRTLGIGGRGSVVSASEFKFEDPGFDPPTGQCEAQFSGPSESTLVQTCACLTPLRVYIRHAIHLCPHVKDPISICHKRVGLTTGVVVAQTMLHTLGYSLIKVGHHDYVAAGFSLVKRNQFPMGNIPIGTNKYKTNLHFSFWAANAERACYVRERQKDK